MTVEMKLNCHLEHIVMPESVPMTARQILDLCDRATEAQRQAALDRARLHIPFILPDEEKEAVRWVKQI